MLIGYARVPTTELVSFPGVSQIDWFALDAGGRGNIPVRGDHGGIPTNLGIQWPAALIPSGDMP